MIGLLLMRTAIRRGPSQHGVLAGAAIIVSILISPHLLIYDTTMLLVPFAIAAHRGVSAPRLQLLAGITIVAAVLTIVQITPIAAINSWTSPATVGLIAVAALWTRWLPAETGVASSDQQDGRHREQRLLSFATPATD